MFCIFSQYDDFEDSDGVTSAGEGRSSQFTSFILVTTFYQETEFGASCASAAFEELVCGLFCKLTQLVVGQM